MFVQHLQHEVDCDMDYHCNQIEYLSSKLKNIWIGAGFLEVIAVVALPPELKTRVIPEQCVDQIERRRISMKRWNPVQKDNIRKEERMIKGERDKNVSHQITYTYVQALFNTRNTKTNIALPSFQ